MKNRETIGLVAAATLAALAISSGTALAYTVKGQVQCTPTGWVPRKTVVQVFEVDPLPGGAYTVNTPALASGTVSDAGAFSLTFAWPAPGPGFEAGGPDLVFRLTQNVGGASVTIYEEKPDKTHWNLADGSSTTLKTDSPQAVCSNPKISNADIPSNKLFLFTRVGSYPTAEIDCNKASVATSSGYAHPRKAGYTGTDADMPFGETLDLFGWVGKNASIAYYKVRYSSDGWVTASEVETPLPNYWYDTSSPNPLAWHWVAESMGPFTEGGQANLYKVPFLVRPDTPWSWLDRIARFDTVRAANGKVRVRIVPYVWNAAHSALVEASASDLVIDPNNFGEIVLQVDNTPPSVQILSVNGSTATCNVVHFGAAATDRITVAFRVFDQRGHLREYTLEAMYGHNQSVSPRPTAPNQAHDDYAHNAAASPAWQGRTEYTTNYVGNVQTPAAMPSCAYQLRLGVSKRTTNGYGLVYPWVEDTWHASIERP